MQRSGSELSDQIGFWLVAQGCVASLVFWPSESAMMRRALNYWWGELIGWLLVLVVLVIDWFYGPDLEA